MIKKINTKILKDDRGSLFELDSTTFISISNKNVIRGLHYQWDKPRSKLITIINGSILDIVVNISPTSTNYCKIEKNILNISNRLYIPEYYAHGFRTLEENTIILYQCNCPYNFLCDGSINPFDKELNIDWEIEIEKLMLSNKDRNGISFPEYKIDPKFI